VSPKNIGIPALSMKCHKKLFDPHFAFFRDFSLLTETARADGAVFDV
jgi:hypothetical protein